MKTDHIGKVKDAEGRKGVPRNKEFVGGQDMKTSKDSLDRWLNKEDVTQWNITQP